MGHRKACPCKTVPVAAAAAVAAVAAMPGVVTGPSGARPTANIGGVGPNIEGTGGANDLYAPDVFVVNGTGHDVALELELGTTGAHDIVPAWRDGTWNVVAHPDGNLTVGTLAVPYLHYELYTASRWQTSSGWVIPRADFPGWAAGTLPRYGFSPAAVASFVRTWADVASGTGKIAVYPQTGAVVEDAEPLAVTGNTVTVRRVWFLIGPAPPAEPVTPAPVDPPAGPVDVQEWGVVFAGGGPTPTMHEWWQSAP